MKIAKTYHGKSCIRCGHTERYIYSSENRCVACRNVYLKKYRDEHKEEYKSYRKKYNDDPKNKEVNKAYQKKYYADPIHKEEKKAYQKKYYVENKEEMLATCKKRYAENKEEIKAYAKKYRDEHKEEIKSCKKKYYADPIHKEEKKACYKKYYVENKSDYIARAAKRRAMKLNQTPPWADLNKIKEIYKNCPKGYEVDHIHPLSKGGLHVHYNLQYLSISENRSKGAKIL